MTTKSPAATQWAAAGSALGVLALGLLAVLLGRPGELAHVSALPWWVFTVGFALAEAGGLNLSLRGRRYPISLVGLPLAAGLYLTDPLSLLVGRLTGGLLVSAGHRRQTPASLLAGAFSMIAGTALAELLFRVLVLQYEVLSYPGRVLTLAVAGLAVLVEVGLKVLVHRVGAGHRREAGGLLARALVIGVLGAAVGLIPAMWLVHDEPLVTGAVLGPGLVLGYWAFASLSERHDRLCRLYRLSDDLAHAPDPARAIPLVLEQSADLLRARYAELMLTDALPAQRSTSGRRLWVLRDGRITGPRTPAPDLLFPLAGAALVRGSDPDEASFLRGRGIDQAVRVPLRIDEQVIGHLVVGDRRGGERGFAPADPDLLQTVADRTAVALGNGHLLERLQFEARHDELTGLPNRLDFRAQLDECVDDLISGGRQCAVMLLDFNGFKAINDTLGHHAGDQLLSALAGRFGKVAGKGVTIARLGGDEFAVLAPGMGDGAARALARRLMSAFDEPVRLDANELRIGGSLGVAVGPEQGTTGAELLRRADVAMYVAKSGGGGYRMFTRSMDLPAEQVHTLATALAEALKEGRIGIAVQPVVDLVSGQVHALEALARWNHPELGEVPPEDFFAAAERSGLVVELSRCVLDQALAGARQWLDAGQRVRVAINLAPGWLADPSLPEQITTALAVHDLPPELLVLEVNEADVIDEPDTAHGVLAALTRLREIGVRLSVDDFGTGYSSLTFLNRLPVDQIKIHQSFVQELRSAGRDRAVVQSIIDLGRNLGLEVVAEGVADALTRIELKRMGCRFGQGYYFTAPMAVGELAWQASGRLQGFGPWTTRLLPNGFPPVPAQPTDTGDRLRSPLDAPLDTRLDTLAECSTPTTARPPSAP
ncbi:EAL domain-containing protein [Kineosporia rhizophila]|uniref:putative bifunctional diguanylate cyclase/phosphodiesterase n=1 Tax=Kineosporia rhizophila TaxID=84633 RepID=UPI001E4BBD39|nr:EAL domain-containing protein [Kineosporia rhizophila]